MRYQQHMQHIHNQATASAIEVAAFCLMEDVVELLIKTGVKPEGTLLTKIRELQRYEYGKITPVHNEPRASK